MRRFFILTILLTFSLALACDLSEKKADPASSNVDSLRVLPTQEIEDFTIVETKGGDRIYEAEAAYAAIYKDKSEILTTDVHVIFYGEEGGFSTLTADSAFIDEESKDMRAVGDVVVVTEDGVKLESEELIWKHRQERITSDHFVRLTRGRDVLTGIGLVTDAALQKAEILKDMKMEVRDMEPEDL